ncbi:MAG: BtpA/SgcQ family protein [Candidatus Thalassarchaeaceae archaeon]|nr:BtpA/SgcQ family protein [Candidatus Thalassarchaeaceae archaeon]
MAERKDIPLGLIGMVHLKALPGSPNYSGDLDYVEAIAIADAQALIAGGVAGIMVENFGDVPFFKDRVPTITITAMTRIIRSIVELSDIPVGVNVLRNDAKAAISIAAATGAKFIRVNVHIGAMQTDQGIIEGLASETLRLRENLGPGIAILADVGVKHAAAIDEDWTLEQESRDCWHRGLADALIISGKGTGMSTKIEDLVIVKNAVPDAPLIIGSGVNMDNATAYLEHAASLIVGTSLKIDSSVEKAVDLQRVTEFTSLVINS